MRRFIYLDTDTLNSYLAQIFDGLIQSQEMEKSAGKKKEKQNHFGSNLGSQIAFKLFGKGIDANAQATYEHLKTVANDEMVRDVQTKIMHDNAFDEFASYLSENGLLGGANIGNFISVEDEFYIFDILFKRKRSNKYRDLTADSRETKLCKNKFGILLRLLLLKTRKSISRQRR